METTKTTDLIVSSKQKIQSWKNTDPEDSGIYRVAIAHPDPELCFLGIRYFHNGNREWFCYNKLESVFNIIDRSEVILSYKEIE